MGATTGSLGFDRDIAQLVGVECAVLYQNISFWTETNKANKRNFFEEKYWTYNSTRAFSELFPFWSAGKIVRLLNKLEDNGFIESGEFNKNKYDRTKWYTAIYQNSDIHLSKMTNGVVKNDKPIPDINTDIKPIDVRKEKNTETKYTKDDIRLTDSLYLTIGKFFPNHTKLVNRKAKEADYMELNKLQRIDGYEYKKIEEVLRWLYTNYKPSDSFDWKKQILSTNKLRKHFFNLSEQFDSDKKSGKFPTQKYSAVPPDKRKASVVPSEKERVVSDEDAEKNKIILELIRQKKATFGEHKTLKSKTTGELRNMLNSV